MEEVLPDELSNHIKQYGVALTKAQCHDVVVPQYVHLRECIKRVLDAWDSFDNLVLPENEQAARLITEIRAMRMAYMGMSDDVHRV